MQQINGKRPLIIIAGPTAAGKSEIAVMLARQIGGEVISADSMQVYRGMDIGSAKITPAQMEGVPHHLIDVLDPEESFDVVRFQSLTREAVRQIYSRGRIPIIAGGTGFYIQSVLYDVDFTDNDADTQYRKELEEMFDKGEGALLFEKLRQVDPVSATLIHPNNRKRVIRALEFYQKTGLPISAHNEKERKKEAAFESAYFVLTDAREKLYARIDARVDKMMAQGLLEEVRQLAAKGLTKDMVSMQGLGYKELLAYLEGEYSLDEAVYRIKRDSRHFAKRQLTWFRRERDVIWADRSILGTDENILSFMMKELKERGII